ncbi:uncharacterized protein HMPREF1541_04702 [Cyphellophora europaea CBS 101466]|uniref:BTB domain-containing protein n=1 Tax=Cyphellophora europaea (strain CBS 101466) TaxID=1220924 RepID=W2RVU4_CYPE1|nr:uncharacterized protein HMPREF1541_04702 [Cyphellophora europaea CBS 101466]ETN40425.1 hypothetical protein HMPREF1541_04702 [Cyphellophora europaea CBS 101466]
MEYERGNAFPSYSDGDVAIYLSPEMTYQLHSQVLKQHSTFFEEKLSVPGTKLTAKARKDGAAAYCFELVSRSQDDPGVLQQREVQENGKVKNSIFASGLNLRQMMVSNAKLRHWGFLFGIFYGKPPGFDEDNTVQLVTDCHEFIDVAKSMGAIERIRDTVDLALLRQDMNLWTSIANNPKAWAGLGRDIHSPTIYKEALCHLVGKWRQIDPETKSEMDEDMKSVIQTKYDALESSKEVIELRILGHYPPALCRNATDKPGRPSYSGDIYMWMAICFFRQWFAQAISEHRTRLGLDGGFKFYQAIYQSSQAYLHHEDFQQFYQYFPMSSKGRNVLESNMNLLKSEVKDFVEKLIINRSHMPNGSVDWFTCANILKSDLPWENEEGLADEAQLHDDIDTVDDGNEDEVQAPVTQGKDKGRGKAKASPVPSGTRESSVVAGSSGNKRKRSRSKDAGTAAAAPGVVDGKGKTKRARVSTRSVSRGASAAAARRARSKGAEDSDALADDERDGE